MTEETKFQVPWRWAIGTAAVLAVALGVVAFRGPAGVSVAASRVSRKDLVVPILSDGSLEPPPGGELRAPEAATVAAIPAREGDRVATGTALVVLESPELTQAALAARSTAAQLSEEQVRAAGELEQSKREAAHAREVFEADARLLREARDPARDVRGRRARVPAGGRAAARGAGPLRFAGHGGRRAARASISPGPRRGSSSGAWPP